MKKLIQKSMLMLAFVTVVFNANSQVVADSVVMGPFYANDIYYSFRNGTVLSTPRITWDIAFQSTIWSATILTNGASGVELYTYPNADTSGWATLDTTGMAGWTLLYNSDQTWDEGAFNRNQAGYPDYGWGKYNPITHDVVGDSLYVVKGLDGTYRKLWILRKNSIGNTYYLRYADLDGANENYDTLDNNPYLGKNFSYYTFGNDGLIDREPDTAAWDVVFTKYMDIQPDGTPYPVTGVLNNTKVYANRFHPVTMDFTDWLSQPMDSTLQPIGYDWKTFSMQTFQWSVEDSLVFFVQTWGDDIYKLYFTGFGGSSTGKAFFNKELISGTGVKEILPAAGVLTISPNPVADHMTFRFSEAMNGTVSYDIFDLNGRKVLAGQTEASASMARISIPAGTLVTGMHLVIIRAGNEAYASKIIVSNR